MSFTNGHPTRKFRNIQPIKVNGELDMYNFEKVCIELPKQMNSYKNLYDETENQVKKLRADGLTEKQLCEANINKTRRIKMKIQMLKLAEMSMKDEEKIGEWKKKLYGDYIEFAHGVIICAYLGACVWGDDFGISLADGTMPLVPEDEIGNVCRQIAEEAKKQFKKMEEKKSAEPKKFTDNFTPETIKQGEEWFLKEFLSSDDDCECGMPHFIVEHYYEMFYDCKNWATGEYSLDKTFHYTFNAKDTKREEFDERMDEFYVKITLFLFSMSIFTDYERSGKVKPAEEDFTHFRAELEKNGFQIIRERTLPALYTNEKQEYVGHFGIYSNEDWKEAISNSSPIGMEKTEKKTKKARLCACGCRTFKKKLKKAECCGVRYVDAEHQKKHWAEHKKECEELLCGVKCNLCERELPVHTKKRHLDTSDPIHKCPHKPFKLPTNYQEELAMWVCPMSCEGCDYCNYKPQFCSIDID